MTELYAKLFVIMCTVQAKIKAFFEEEKGAVDIVAIVVIIGVAVLLAIVFKDQLGELIGDLFGTISGNATDVVNKPIGG